MPAGGHLRTDLPRDSTTRRLTLAVSEAYAEDFQAGVSATFDRSPWPDSLRAAAYEMVRWPAGTPRRPGGARSGAVEAGEAARARRDGSPPGSGVIDAGRAVAPDPDAVPPGAA